MIEPMNAAGRDGCPAYGTTRGRGKPAKGSCDCQGDQPLREQREISDRVMLSDDWRGERARMQRGESRGS